MFESAELGHKIAKDVYEKEVPALREKLLDVQYELLEKQTCAVAMIVGGVDGGGRGAMVNLLYEWLDPRHLETHATEPASGEECERPRMYRFWQRLPRRGKIGIFLGSWYTDPIINRSYRKSKPAELDSALDEIVRFERMLSNERVLVLKFWLHLSRKAQKRRLKALEDDPKTAWRVSPLDWERFEMYDRFRKISERSLRVTSTAVAPWYVVESNDDEYRSLTVGTILHDAIKRRLDDPVLNAAVHTPPIIKPIDQRDLLGSFDPTPTIEKEKYNEQLASLQGKLNSLFRDPDFAHRNVVAVFEGVDAAGKGGAIRRITGALDARQYRVIPVAAPTDEEKARPYLWRFWRNLPRAGKLAIFDRSWYGRVLVERIEKFCDEDDWARAYSEINDFEEALTKSGTIIVKFWLQISNEEQLRRFKEREQTSFKRFKITAEDWRNREKWDAYQNAASEMIDRTSTDFAPWTLVAANDKRNARIHVLETLTSQIQRRLG
ncbi:MAG: polyphosphate:AMP phosphotransferase [Polyangiaceae bacterium]